MSNLFSRERVTGPSDEHLFISNGGTAVFISVLAMAGTSVANTRREKDLVAWLGPAVARIHDPVARHLQPALAVDVGDRRQLHPERAAEARLLLDLAECAALVRLSSFELSLREGPILPVRPVDEQDLHFAVRRVPHDDTARGPDHPLASLRSHVPSMPHGGPR